jgi:hypothetical protein
MYAWADQTAGLKRLDDGSFVKDFEGAEGESEHAVQMTLSKVASEDPRFMERPAPPLAEEFPEGSNLFFLGEHAYGVAAKVSAATDSTLSIMIAVRVLAGMVQHIACSLICFPVLPLGEGAERPAQGGRHEPFFVCVLSRLQGFQRCRAFRARLEQDHV